MTLRVLFALLLLLPPAARAGVVDDMAAFERLFIPALALTNQPKLPAERTILDALEQTLARADRAETRSLAGRLKSGFAQIYVMFGDFGEG